MSVFPPEIFPKKTCIHIPTKRISKSLQTLVLACVSLASKATESPRRMREILPPAYRLLQASAEHSASSTQQQQQPSRLIIPSALYDNLRATLVQAEVLLLRVLGFELKVSLPLDFIPRYLERAFQDPVDAGEDYDSWSMAEKEEYGVLPDVSDTGMGRACRIWAVRA